MIGLREIVGHTRREKRCPLCRRSRYRGKLWIGGKDYVDCPDCEGSGTFVVYRQPIAPPGARVFLPGQTYPGTIIPVELESA